MRGIACAVLLLIGTAASAQVPPADSRNTDIPDTDTHFVAKAFWRHASHGTLAQWEQRRKFLRGQILSAAALDPMPEKTPLNPRIFDRLERDGYTIEKVVLETMPGFFLGGNLYRPARRSGKFPAVLYAHGHFREGRLENTVPSSPGYTHLASTPGFGINMARMGFVVFAWDMVGWNDTRQTPHEFGGPRENLWSFTPMGLQLWNSTRALDFVESLPDVDATRIGMTGASGGGSQTFFLTAIDDRIKASAPVNMVSAIMQGGSPCENAPNLRLETYNVEIAAMMAPRPMLIVSSPWDQSRNTGGEESVVIRGIYALFGQSNQVETVEIEAQHNYGLASREAAYRFFAKRLMGDADYRQYQEKPFTMEKHADLLAFSDQSAPKNASDYEGVFREWRERTERAAQQPVSPGVAKARLAYVLGAEWPSRVVKEISDGAIELGRAGRGDRISGLWTSGKGRPLLLVDPQGSAAASKSELVQKAIAAGRPVLLIDAFQTGHSIAERDRSPRYFLTFNRSDDANRVQDILTALAFLRSQSDEEVEVIGKGNAGIWCLFAAAVAPPGKLKVEYDRAVLPTTDDDYLQRFNVPGIARVGGTRAALKLVEGHIAR